MTRQLWAPWRLEYVGQAEEAEAEGCFLCAPEERLLVARAERTIVVLNKFPYSSGHLLVAPTRHVGDFTELEADEALEVHRQAAAAVDALRSAYAPDGVNLGWNLGRAAGAGIVDHVHLHIVPRWSGDTNFMPVLADVKVLPEHLDATRSRLAAAWPGPESAPPDG